MNDICKKNQECPMGTLGTKLASTMMKGTSHYLLFHVWVCCRLFPIPFGLCF